MTNFRRIAVTALWFVTAGAGLASAQEFKAGNLMIDHPWSRATPAGAQVAAGYMVITNKGSEPDRLVGGSTSVAGKLEIHEMAMKDGVMTMRPVSGGLTVEPGKTVTLAPGGYHLMFVSLKSPLKQGEKFSATLEFQKAGKVEVTFEVQPVGAQSPMHGDGGHKM
jgi:periplasmic copper chaperone A